MKTFFLIFVCSYFASNNTYSQCTGDACSDLIVTSFRENNMSGFEYKNKNASRRIKIGTKPAFGFGPCGDMSYNVIERNGGKVRIVGMRCGDFQATFIDPLPTPPTPSPVYTIPKPNPVVKKKPEMLKSGNYRIRNLKTNRYLIAGSEFKNDLTMRILYESTENVKWKILFRKDGSYIISPKSNSLKILYPNFEENSFYFGREDSITENMYGQWIIIAIDEHKYKIVDAYNSLAHLYISEIEEDDNIVRYVLKVGEVLPNNENIYWDFEICK